MVSNQNSSLENVAKGTELFLLCLSFLFILYLIFLAKIEFHEEKLDGNSFPI
jgi:hypothetical protein